MTVLLWLIVVAWLSYIAGRLAPDPYAPWEQTLRQRAFEWRLWWISDRIRRAEQHREALQQAWTEGSGR